MNVVGMPLGDEFASNDSHPDGLDIMHCGENVDISSPSLLSPREVSFIESKLDEFPLNQAGQWIFFSHQHFSNIHNQHPSSSQSPERYIKFIDAGQTGGLYSIFDSLSNYDSSTSQIDFDGIFGWTFAQLGDVKSLVNTHEHSRNEISDDWADDTICMVCFSWSWNSDLAIDFMPVRIHCPGGVAFKLIFSVLGHRAPSARITDLRAQTTYASRIVWFNNISPCKFRICIPRAQTIISLHNHRRSSRNIRRVLCTGPHYVKP